MALASTSTFSELRVDIKDCSTGCCSSLHSRHVGSAAASSRWAYALSSGVCPDRRRPGRTATARFEVAMQSEFQERCSYTMAVRGLLGGESAMGRWMRALAVVNEMYFDGVTVVSTAAAALSSLAALLYLSLGAQERMVGPFLLFSRWRICQESRVPLSMAFSRTLSGAFS